MFWTTPGRWLSRWSLRPLTVYRIRIIDLLRNGSYHTPVLAGLVNSLAAAKDHYRCKNIKRYKATDPPRSPSLGEFHGSNPLTRRDKYGRARLAEIVKQLGLCPKLPSAENRQLLYLAPGDSSRLMAVDLCQTVKLWLAASTAYREVPMTISGRDDLNIFPSSLFDV